MNGGASVVPPEEFSVCDCDRYAEHLAEISVQRRMVVAVDDLRNQFGVLLLRRGAPLGSFAFGKMRGHRLNRPLDEALEMRGRLDASALAARLDALIAAEPDLARIHARFDFAPRTAELFATAAPSPALLQKLSVLEVILPQVFHRALFTAWFAALLARERGLAAGEATLLFQAGLLHDLGLLHIDPALADKKSGITAEEWLAIQRHVLIGAVIAGSLADAPSRLPRMILHHHERGDGSGYPAGRSAGDIEPLACILTLCDMLHALRFHSPFVRGGTLADCVPHLRVNRDVYGEQNYAGAARVLRAARAADEAPTLRALPRPLLLDTNRSLVTVRALFAVAQPLIAQQPPGPALASLERLLAQLDWVSRASGLGREDFAATLDQSIMAEPGDPGLLEIQLTAQEMFWLVRRIERQLQALVGDARAGGPGTALSGLARDLQFELRRAWQRFDT